MAAKKTKEKTNEKNNRIMESNFTVGAALDSICQIRVVSGYHAMELTGVKRQGVK